ncbi:DUF6348 family protein [Catellatospora sp. NPDC049133]|uniref:DUF6348 family protein n=1 Tax=Catellatospora sp. NPDC049133 TaxID=3155499 RepID=UPI0033D7ADDB
MFDAAVAAGIAAFLNHPDHDEDQIVAVLREQGVADWLAERLVTYLPIVFGRYLLRACTFDPDVVDGEGRRPLDSDPVFRAAHARAQHPTHEELKQIGLRSAEVNAVNQMPDSKLEDLVFSATHLPSPLPPAEPGDGGVPSPGVRFAQLLDGHGLTTGHDAHGWYAGELRFGASLITHPAPMVLGQLDFAVQHPALAVDRLVESVAAHGDTWRASIDRGTAMFAESSLHVLLAALVDRAAHTDQVEWERYEHPSGPFDVCVGPQISFFAQDIPPAGDAFGAVLTALHAVPLSRQAHGLRVFLCYQNGRLITNEVLLDNEPCPAGMATVPEQRDDLPQQMAAFRIFAMLVPA